VQVAIPLTAPDYPSGHPCLHPSLTCSNFGVGSARPSDSDFEWFRIGFQRSSNSVYLKAILAMYDPQLGGGSDA
jgi:hypothetical protein